MNAIQKINQDNSNQLAAKAGYEAGAALSRALQKGTKIRNPLDSYLVFRYVVMPAVPAVRSVVNVLGSVQQWVNGGVFGPLVKSQ